MKRPTIAKRRDRSAGQSPYARHSKVEYRYSPAYQVWAEQFRPRKASQGKDRT